MHDFYSESYRSAQPFLLSRLLRRGNSRGRRGIYLIGKQIKQKILRIIGCMWLPLMDVRNSSNWLGAFFFLAKLQFSREFLKITPMNLQVFQVLVRFEYSVKSLSVRHKFNRTSGDVNGILAPPKPSWLFALIRAAIDCIFFTAINIASFQYSLFFFFEKWFGQRSIPFRSFENNSFKAIKKKTPVLWLQ